MYRIVATYNHPEDPDAFLEHYRTSHAVKTQRMPGLRSFTWGRAQAPDGSDPDHFLVAVLDFDDHESAVSAMSSPEGAEAVADMEQMPHNGFSMNAYQTQA